MTGDAQAALRRVIEQVRDIMRSAFISLDVDLFVIAHVLIPSLPSFLPPSHHSYIS